MANLLITDRDGNAKAYNFDQSGTTVDPFSPKSPPLIGALTSSPASSPSAASASLNEILRGVWQSIINIGTAPTMNDYNSMGAAVSGVIKASSGNLHILGAINLGATIRYLQLFDRTTVPTAGLVPLKCYPVYPGGGFTPLDSAWFGISAKGKGLFFATGISWGMSTTALTYTAATSSETIVEARFV